MYLAAAGIGRFADRVQELHVKVVHILIELVERALFPENYRDMTVGTIG
jgi:D-sedoheptulose 7-phosphate isomerase